MPLGASRLNGLAKLSAITPPPGNLFSEGTGTTPASNTFTYSVGTGVTVATSVGYWNGECAYTNHMAESSGVASSPQFNLIYSFTNGTTSRRIVYRGSTGTGTTLTQGTQVNIDTTTGAVPNRLFVVGSRFDANSSNWCRGRFLRYRNGSAANQNNGTGYFHNGSSTGQTTTVAALSWHSTSTHIYYGGTMTGIGGETFYYHEWYRDNSGQLNVRINQAPKDFTTAYTETANITLSTNPHIDNLNDCVKGLGTPSNTRGLSFMFNVNTVTGKDELLISNGYVISKIENIFGYAGISSSNTIDVIGSVTVSKSNNQGAISYWNNTTKKFDVAFFTVTCPNTSTITVTWGSLFTQTFTNESKVRLGKGNSNTRFTITSVNSAGTGVLLRTGTSTGINNFTISNSATVGTGYSTINHHTGINRFIDGAGGDNTMFVGILAGTTLYAHAVNRG